MALSTTLEINNNDNNPHITIVDTQEAVVSACARLSEAPIIAIVRLNFIIFDVVVIIYSSLFI